MISTVITENYLKHEQQCLESGRRTYESFWTFLECLKQAKDELGEEFYQLQASVCQKLSLAEKTVKNYLGTYENAVEKQWQVPALSIGHHTAVDDPKLDPGEKEQLLTRVLENGLSVEETRALKKEYKANRDGEPSPIEKEMTAMEELQQALDDAQTRCAVAERLLIDARRLIKNLSSGNDDPEKRKQWEEEVEAWTLNG